jgi:NAD(P)H-dependent FMN reductase
MRKPKIVAFAGSARKDSFNKKLIHIGAEAAREAGADVKLIDLNDYPLPLYNADLEEAQGLPENVKKLRKLFIETDGFLISSPEYNSSISPALKNVIDWVSRPQPNEVYLVAYRNKIAGIMSASPGGLGGLRSLVHLRDILENIYTMVLPLQTTVPNAAEAFDEKGQLKDKAKEKEVKQIATTLVHSINKLILSDNLAGVKQ